MVENEIFQLASTDGWNAIRVLVTDEDGHSRPTRVASVMLSGQFWNRLSFEGGDRASTGLVPDFEIQLLQVMIGTDRLSELASCFDSVQIGRSVELCDGAKYQRFMIALTKDEGVISGDKPVCVCTYRTERARGEVKFVTDQSCIRLAREGILRWLRAQTPG